MTGYGFALSPIWSSWLSNKQVPCRLVLTKEHVIPKSVLPSSITSKPHNVIGFPMRLNSRRSNNKYVESDKPGLPIWPCKECRNPGCPLIGRITTDGFVPPTLYKPVIGASILKSLYENQDIIHDVHYRVLDLGTALRWTNELFEDLPDEIKNEFRVN